jgi:hypothetical protein
MDEKKKVKVGDMAKVLWTEGCDAPTVVGLVIKVELNGGLDYELQYDRPRALMFCQGSPTWFDAYDLEVVSKS